VYYTIKRHHEDYAAPKSRSRTNTHVMISGCIHSESVCEPQHAHRRYAYLSNGVHCVFFLRSLLKFAYDVDTTSSDVTLSNISLQKYTQLSYNTNKILQYS